MALWGSTAFRWTLAGHGNFCSWIFGQFFFLGIFWRSLYNVIGGTIISGLAVSQEPQMSLGHKLSLYGLNMVFGRAWDLCWSSQFCGLAKSWQHRNGDSTWVKAILCILWGHCDYFTISLLSIGFSSHFPQCALGISHCLLEYSLLDRPIFLLDFGRHVGNRAPNPPICGIVGWQI